ncbi:MAG: molybdenum cofactor guanylyltransferase [Gemmatimonadetes bacterium]|nr:molybdenum cofactor guanylyltransferase [Gemmatimonadota bacterium]
MTQRPAFGAILAGGLNRRYGSPKALARLGDDRIIDRVQRALRGVTPDVVLIANEPQVYAALGLPMRPDTRPALGALGGIYSALRWAREERRPGVLAVACDMPFLESALLARLLELGGAAPLARAAAPPGLPAAPVPPSAAGTGRGDAPALPDLAAPESGSRRGLEPLCAYYAVSCIPAIEAEIDRGERHIVGFYKDVRVATLPLAEVQQFGDPGVLFLNVNTPEERERAERIAASRRQPPAGVSSGG